MNLYYAIVTVVTLAIYSCNASEVDHATLRRRLQDQCDETSWPDKDHGLVCGDCKVLVNNFAATYGTCTDYCATIGRECTGAWDEVDDSCTQKNTMTCSQTLASSDAICECGNPAPAPVSWTCGVATCTTAVLNTMAGDYSCNDRIQWLQTASGGQLSEADACTKVAKTEFPWQCGGCDPANAAPSPVAPAPVAPAPSPATTPGAMPAPTPEPVATPSSGSDQCDEASWPDLDHGRTCGDCKVLVNNFAATYGTCTGYCANVGRQCTGAWEEENETCTVKFTMTCSQTLSSSDAICECAGAPVPLPTPHPVAPVDPNAARIKALSFNLFGWNAFRSITRTASMMGLINAMNPDVYGAQELEGKTSMVGWAIGMTPVYGWDIHGLNIFYNPSKLRKEAQFTFNLNERDQWGQRIVMGAQFTHIASGRGFYYYNTHWCVCSENSLFGTAQTSAQEVSGRQRGDLPALYGGDLNVFGGTDNSKAVRYLSGQTVDGLTSPVEFQDTYAVGGRNGGPGTHGSARIDYIFAMKKTANQPGFNVIRGEVLQKESGSDHNGVLAEVAFV